MSHEFDHDYWKQHWQDVDRHRPGPVGAGDANPHLVRETADLEPGTALDAGCGRGAEAVALAARGWRVTAVDLAPAALGSGAENADRAGVADRVSWVQADLGTWRPDAQFDLVTTHYAHARLPQLELYRTLAGWVAPGGTLLVVAHGHARESHDQHQHHKYGTQRNGPPTEVSVTAPEVAGLLDPREWEVVTSDESVRATARQGAPEALLHDVVVRARRLCQNENLF